MLKYLFAILLLPCLLMGQVQVSDIESYGVYNPTDIRYNVGFAKIDGVQYMIEEKDSVVISKYENGLFNKLHVIDNPNCDLRIFNTIKPNRSFFKIEDQTYFRFLIDGLQLINIIEGNIEYEYDFSNDGITRVLPSEMVGNLYYFNGLKEGVNGYQRYRLDLSNDEIVQINLTDDRDYLQQFNDLIAGVESGQNLYIFNARTNTDSLVFESLEGIHTVSYSELDNSFVILEQNGKLWKVDESLKLENVQCSITDISDLQFIKVNGSKAIMGYNHIIGEERQDRIVIIDLGNCDMDMTFVTDKIEYYAYYVQHVIFESNNEDFSIFGYYGFDPADGLSLGTYYIIDHNKNTFTHIPEMSSIQNYTSVVEDNSIYFVCNNTSFWGGYEYIVQYDIHTQSITKPDPNPTYATEYVTLGFWEEDGLINVTNTEDESPAIWNYDGEGNFEMVQPLNFLFNIGAGYIDNIFPMEDKLYFSTFSGVYSVNKNSETEYIFSDYPYPNVAPRYNQMAKSGNKLAVASFGDETPKFTVLNTKTGEVDSVVDNQIKASHGQAAGPFIFYSEGSGDSELHFFDLKTNTIETFGWIPYMLDQWLVRGVNNAFYYHDSSFGNNVVYLIDYKTNKFKLIGISIRYFEDIVRGYDDSFYIVDRDFGSDDSRIRLLTKDGSVKTIYEGKGDYDGSSDYSEDNAATIINLIYNNEASIFVTNDLSNTSVFELPHAYTSFYGDEILDSENGKILFETEDENDDIHYWIYEAFEPAVEIAYDPNKVLAFSDLTDQRATLVFYDRDDESTDILNYYFDTNEKSVIEDIENDCGRYRAMDGIAISEDEYLITMSCNNGYEPWLLNVKEGSLELISDYFPGVLSSYPRHFTRYKDWIYFTLRKKDYSAQWFRMNANFPTAIVEVFKKEDLGLNAYPSPASDVLYLDSDLNEVFIYTMNGTLVHKINDYRKNQPVNVDLLNNGKYFIIGTDSDQNLKEGSFIKMK